MVKKWLVPALVLMMVVAPPDAVGAKKKKKPKAQQVVEGSVDLPQGDPTGAVGRCVSGNHRRLVLLNVPAQGVVGFDFDVDKATWNGKFVLEVDGDQDLDIIFYTDFGDLQAAGETVAYEEDGSGGESGTIPSNMTKAIVCMFSGLNAAFTYTGTGK